MRAPAEDFPYTAFPSEIERHQRYMSGLAARLRCVCANLSEPEFAELVADVAAMALRFQELELTPGGEMAYHPGLLPLAELPPSRDATLPA